MADAPQPARTPEVRSVVSVVGNPRQGSRTARVATAVGTAIEARLADRGLSARHRLVEVAALGADVLDPSSAAFAAAADEVRAASVVVVASPTYKGNFTGLLKLFLDGLPPGAVEGAIAVPLMVGGSERHALAPEVHLRPVLAELGALTPARALFVVESELDVLDEVVARWWATSARAFDLLHPA